MTAFAIATSVYDQDQRFVSDYLAGVADAARGHDVTLIAAADYGYDASRALAGLSGAAVEIHSADRPQSPTGLRQLMLDAVAASGADIVIFTDFDDRLISDALAAHESALADADISYGDLELMDESGQSLNRCFFEGAGVPERASADALSARNFIGFGNSAVRRKALAAQTVKIPQSVTAADWWFFSTLLNAGLKAKRTDRPVGRYRTHAHSVLGGTGALSPDALRRRAEIALAHYRALSESAPGQDRIGQISNLLDWIAREPDEVAVFAKSLVARRGVWFDDVAFACDAAAASKTRYPDATAD